MRARWPVWFTLLIIAAVAAVAFAGTGVSTALKLPIVTVLSPLQGALKGAIDGAAGFAEGIAAMSTMAEENRELRRQIDALQSEVVRLREAGEENQQLRALLQYQRDNPGREYLSAMVVAADPSSLVRSVLISRGSDAGVQEGMVVVTELGLVGKTVEVYPKVSRVLLVTDPSSVVNGVVQRTRVEGVVTGRPDQKLGMEYVPKSADVAEGDLVVSSGLGGGYPRGLLLGRAASVVNNDQNLFKTIVLEPAVRFSPLRSVLVIRDFIPIDLPR